MSHYISRCTQARIFQGISNPILKGHCQSISFKQYEYVICFNILFPKDRLSGKEHTALYDL